MCGDRVLKIGNWGRALYLEGSLVFRLDGCSKTLHRGDCQKEARVAA